MSKGPIQKQTIERDERNKTRVEETCVLCRVPEEQLFSMNLEKLLRAEVEWNFQRERNFPGLSLSHLALKEIALTYEVLVVIMSYQLKH